MARGVPIKRVREPQGPQDRCPAKEKREIAREVKGNGNFRATEVKGGETFEGDRVDSSIREVKWNDPEKCLLEFQEEVTELF